MDDDFNTAQALGHVFDMVRQTNNFIVDEKKCNHRYIVTTQVPMNEPLTECRSPRYGKQRLLGERRIEASDGGKWANYFS